MAKAGVLGSITPTRSPGSTPACSNSVATRGGRGVELGEGELEILATQRDTFGVAVF